MDTDTIAARLTAARNGKDQAVAQANFYAGQIAVLEELQAALPAPATPQPADAGADQRHEQS